MKNLSLLSGVGIFVMIATNVGAAECNSKNFRKFFQDFEYVYILICENAGIEVEYRCDNGERYLAAAEELLPEEVAGCPSDGVPPRPNGDNGGVTYASSGGPVIVNLNDSNSTQYPWNVGVDITPGMLSAAYEDFQPIQPAIVVGSVADIFDLNPQNNRTFDAIQFIVGESDATPISYPADPLIRWGLADSNSSAKFCEINADLGFCNETATSILSVSIEPDLVWADILQNPASTNSTNYINTVVGQLPRNIAPNEGRAIALDLAARQLFLDTLAGKIQGQ